MSTWKITNYRLRPDSQIPSGEKYRVAVFKKPVYDSSQKNSLLEVHYVCVGSQELADDIISSGVDPDKVHLQTYSDVTPPRLYVANGNTGCEALTENNFPNARIFDNDCIAINGPGDAYSPYWANNTNCVRNNSLFDLSWDNLRIDSLGRILGDLFLPPVVELHEGVYDTISYSNGLYFPSGSAYITPSSTGGQSSLAFTVGSKCYTNFRITVNGDHGSIGAISNNITYYTLEIEFTAEESNWSNFSQDPPVTKIDLKIANTIRMLQIGSTCEEEWLEDPDDDDNDNNDPEEDDNNDPGDPSDDDDIDDSPEEEPEDDDISQEDEDSDDDGIPDSEDEDDDDDGIPDEYDEDPVQPEPPSIDPVIDPSSSPEPIVQAISYRGGFFRRRYYFERFLCRLKNKYLNGRFYFEGFRCKKYEDGILVETDDRKSITIDNIPRYKQYDPDPNNDGEDNTVVDTVVDPEDTDNDGLKDIYDLDIGNDGTIDSIVVESSDVTRLTPTWNFYAWGIYGSSLPSFIDDKSIRKL